MDNSLALVIRLVRMIAVLFFLLGLVLFFDAFGLATTFGMAEGGINQIAGAAVMILAVVDAVLVPGFLADQKGKKK